jgi:hypothetical protein
MNCHRPWGLFTELQEPRQDVFGRVGAIQEIELGVVDALTREAPRIVIFFVEANHKRDVPLLEVRHIVFRSESEVAFHRLF